MGLSLKSGHILSDVAPVDRFSSFAVALQYVFSNQQSLLATIAAPTAAAASRPLDVDVDVESNAALNGQSFADIDE